MEGSSAQVGVQNRHSLDNPFNSESYKQKKSRNSVARTLFASKIAGVKKPASKDSSKVRTNMDAFDFAEEDSKSPTLDLAEDLNDNFFIDRTPRAPTPRRSLFHSFVDDKESLAAGSPLACRLKLFSEGGVAEVEVSEDTEMGEVDGQVDQTPLVQRTLAFESTLRNSPDVSPTSNGSPHSPHADSSSEDEEDSISPQSDQPPFSMRGSNLFNLKKKKDNNGPRLPLGRKSNNVAFKHINPLNFNLKSRSLTAPPHVLEDVFNGSSLKRERKMIPSFPPIFESPIRQTTSPAAIQTSLPEPPFPGSPMALNQPINQDSSGSPFEVSPAAPPRMRPSLSRIKARRTLSMFGNPEETIPSKDMETPRKPLAPIPAIPVGHDESEDGDHILPSFMTENNAVRRIRNKTLIDALNGKYNDKIDELIVVDCRFEYEYSGGHVKGAINCNTLDQMQEKFFGNLQEEVQSTRVIIFHCEYSAHRAPRMALSFRNLDRSVNLHRYPELSYPQIYILDGGYSGFFKSFSTHCEPQNYVEMNDASHKNTCEREMGKFRRRSKLSRAQSFTFGSGSSLDSVGASVSPTGQVTKRYQPTKTTGIPPRPLGMPSRPKLEHSMTTGVINTLRSKPSNVGSSRPKPEPKRLPSL